MNVTLLSIDQEGKVASHARIYGMYKEEREHIAYRGSFIVDKNRKVATDEKIILSVRTSMVQAVVGLAQAPNKDYYTQLASGLADRGRGGD